MCHILRLREREGAICYISYAMCNYGMDACANVAMMEYKIKYIYY